MADRLNYDRYGDALGASAEPVAVSISVPTPPPHPHPSGGGDGTTLGSATISEPHSRQMSPRPRSDFSGPVVGRLRLDGRSGSTPQRTGPYMGALAAAKAAQESAILTAMRRQLETLEDKLGSQIVRVQQQGDRLRDAAFTRVDAKMGQMEALQPKFDRKLAELSGNYKGLSDEMQAQIRRIDQMDTRFWEWRHQLEDEIRTKFAEFETGHKQLNSAIRLEKATNEDSLKRVNNQLRRIDGLLADRLAFADETNQSLAALDARLQEIEAARLQDLAISASGPSSATQRSAELATLESISNGASMASIEVKLAEACRKLEHFEKSFQEVQTDVQAQEERLRSLRTQIESKEESLRISKFDRQDWEARSKELLQAVQDLDKHRIEHGERLEVFQKRFEHQGQAHEEVSDQLRRLQERAYLAPVQVEDPGDYADMNGADAELLTATRLTLDSCTSRLDRVEDQLAEVGSELQTIRSDSELAPRVTQLVESLKQVAPKVMDQEHSIRDLSEKIGTLEAKAAIAAETGKVSEAVAARLGRLEMEVARLKAEVEGSEMPEVHGNEVVDTVEGRGSQRRASATE